MEPIIRIENLWFSYDGRSPVLENVHLSIPAGEFASIVGPNGGGKTTLIRLTLGLLAPSRGRVELFGGAPSRTRLRVGYTPQQIQADRLFPITALDVVLTGRLGAQKKRTPNELTASAEPGTESPNKKPESVWRRISDALPFRFDGADREAAFGALEKMGLLPLAKKSFGELSGGERQRTLIARALCSEPELLILDEPTSNTDPSSTEILYRLLAELNRTVAVLIVSHDLGVVSQYVRSVICVNREVVVHPTSELTGQMVREIYGEEIRLVRHDHRCSGEGHIYFPVSKE